MKKRFYNLIEITMAIAVVGIGISAVMGLLPAALNASKDTVANNYIGGIAETFSNYLESQMKISQDQWNILTPKLLEGPPSTDVYDATKDFSDDKSLKGYGFPEFYTIKAPGFFAVKSSDGSFTGYLRVWGAKVTDIYDPETNGTLSVTDEDLKNYIRIYMELSWPATAPYSGREKRLFVTEFCNPN